MPTVKQETTELNAHVHLISLVMAILDVTLNVQNTTIAPETKYILHNPIYLYQRNCDWNFLYIFPTTFYSINYRHVSNSNVEIHAENPIQMYVVKEQTAKSKITNLFAHVQEVLHFC